MDIGKSYKNGQIMSELSGGVLTVYFQHGGVKARGPHDGVKMQGEWTFSGIPANSGRRGISVTTSSMANGKGTTGKGGWNTKPSSKTANW